MKFLSLFLVIMMLLCSCGTPPVKEQDDSSSEIADTAETVATVHEDSSSDTGKEESVKIDQNTFIGTWNDTPYRASGCGDNHNFFEDGTYRFIYNSMDACRRALADDAYRAGAVLETGQQTH